MLQKNILLQNIPLQVVTAIKETAEVAANKIDEETGEVGCIERIETERKLDLAKLLLEKGLAELAVQPTDFPTADLSFIDNRQADVRIIGTDGTAIYVRPTAFDDLYEILRMVGFLIVDEACLFVSYWYWYHIICIILNSIHPINSCLCTKRFFHRHLQ